MSPEEIYQRWIEQRRIQTADTYADRVMESIAAQKAALQRQHAVARIILVIGASRTGRCAVCCGALLIGVTPFFYLACLAKFIAF